MVLIADNEEEELAKGKTEVKKHKVVQKKSLTDAFKSIMNKKIDEVKEGPILSKYKRPKNPIKIYVQFGILINSRGAVLAKSAPISARHIEFPPPCEDPFLIKSIEHHRVIWR